MASEEGESMQRYPGLVHVRQHAVSFILFLLLSFSSVTGLCHLISGWKLRLRRKEDMQDSWSDFELTNAWSNTSTKSRLICLLLYYLSDYSAFMQKAEKTELNLFLFFLTAYSLWKVTFLVLSSFWIMCLCANSNAHVVYSVIKVIMWYVFTVHHIICQWICAAELTQCCTCSRGSLGLTRIKLTAGINLICNGSEFFQQILIICLAIRTLVSELCCRPWLGALFVSSIWDELGWFSPRHVLVQYINWDCGHTG